MGPEYVLPLGKYNRLGEIVLILHDYLKKIFRDISHELEDKAVYLMTFTASKKDDVKARAREQVAKLRLVKELLRDVKLEALTEDERKLALELLSMLDSLKPTREYFRQLEEEEKKEKE
jgi:hypothetical protein